IAIMLIVGIIITAVVGVNASIKSRASDETSSEDKTAKILKLNDDPIMKEYGITLTGEVVHSEYGDLYVCETCNGKTANEWIDDNITVNVKKSIKTNRWCLNNCLGFDKESFIIPLYPTLNFSKHAETDITFVPCPFRPRINKDLPGDISYLIFDPSTKITKHYEINLTDSEYKELLDKYEYSHALNLVYDIWWYNKYNSENLNDEYYTLINNKEVVQKAVKMAERRHDPSKKETDLGRMSNQDFKRYLYAIDKFGVKYDKSKWVKTAPKVKVSKIGLNVCNGGICDTTVLNPPYKGALRFRSYDYYLGPNYISGMAIKYSKNKNLKKAKIKYMKKETVDFKNTYYSSTMYYKIGYYRKINGKRIVNWSKKTYKTKRAK
ncbi:MAG: hypothetical protein K5656_08560, partial [Lachnospiraceae bacterium]|nr:hypothetical protein [Lachnospiraceae bacterium]